VVVIDPNKFSEDGTVALTNITFNKEGMLLAYGRSSSGSDWQKIRIRKVDSGKEYDEVIQWCKFSSIAWKHDGFFTIDILNQAPWQRRINTTTTVYTGMSSARLS
jgi:Serine proteases of the peptidase family S9A